VGLWEISSYCKIEISGPNSAEWLDGIVANRIPESIGRAALCPMLTPRGHILGDVIVARLAENRCLMIGSPAAEPTYLRWLRRHAQTDDVHISSRSNALCGFSLTGPLAREVLGRVCMEDVSPAGFPFLHARELTIGLAPALAIRVSFTGELGYELYMDTEYQRHVYDVLLRVGQPLGMKHFGVRALNSLRIEKGYGGWGREYTQDYTSIEAGLGALIRTDKASFVGREAVVAQLSTAPVRRLRILAIESHDPDPTGGETVLQAGRPVAQLTSAAFGYTVGYSLGLGYFPVDIDFDARDLEVQLLASRVSARVLEAPPHDPAGKRLRS